MFKKNNENLATHYWLCATLSPLGESDKIADTIKSGTLNWDMVMAQAHRGMVLAALRRCLVEKNLIHLIPTDVASALEGFFDLNAELNGRRRDQILAISACLNQKDIDHVWLKGATHLLSENWQQSSRAMLDIDIWIPNQKQHSLAFSQLANIGYESIEKEGSQTVGLSHHYPPLYKSGETARLELHQHIIRPALSSLLPDNLALNHVNWFEWRGEKLGVLSLTDQAMHAYVQAVHMNGNQFMTGQITLMKTQDFVERLLLAGPAVLNSEQFERLQTDPWNNRAEMFFTYIGNAFNVQSSFQKNAGYERRLRHPTFAKLESFLQRSLTCLRDGRIGPLKKLPQRIGSNLRNIFWAKDFE